MKYINPHKMFIGCFIPNWLARCENISSSEKIVYARLCQFAGKDGECFPRQETIAVEVGLKVDAVNKIIKRLAELKLIESKRVGLGKPNKYKFLWHDLMNPDNGNHESRTMETIVQETDSGTEQETDSGTEHIYKENHIRESYIKRNVFKAPCVDEIVSYCRERNNNVDGAYFYDYYKTRGWLLGKTKMRDWKAAIRTWERNNKDTVPKQEERKLVI